MKLSYLVIPIVFFFSLPALSTNCAFHLGPEPAPLTPKSIEYLLMKLQTYTQIFPGFIPANRVKENYVPLLLEMKEKALNEQEFTEWELAEYSFLEGKLSEAPFQPTAIPGSPNQGLNPQKAREILRFYEDWERELL